MEELSESCKKNRVIVLVDAVDRLAIHGLKYAKTISEDITAFSVVTKKDSEADMFALWNKLNTRIPYVIRNSAGEKTADVLLKYIHSPEYGLSSEDNILVVLPQLVLKNWWQRMLRYRDNQYTGHLLKKHGTISIVILLYYLEEENKAVLAQ